MDSNGCERRVKNAVTNMKCYIVMLTLCVYVYVFLLLIEALFCPLDCNSVTYISCNSVTYISCKCESKVYSSIYKKKQKYLLGWNSQNIKKGNIWICCDSSDSLLF